MSESPSTSAADPRRVAELAANLAAVRARLAAAESQAGRDPGAVTLIAVSKFFPASDVDALAALGVSDFGENKHQEAVVKVGQVQASGLVWHFIGQLQTNKAAAVAGYADQVDSVDRRSLVTALDKGARAAGRKVDVLIQVSLDDVPTAGRGGADPAAVAELAEAIEAAEQLRLRGVMGVAPKGEDPAVAFARLVQSSRELRRVYPKAQQVSAGMSGDIEAAVAAGATHVRVGTALLGARPALR